MISASMQMRGQLEAATAVVAEVAEALQATRDESCTTATSTICVYRKAGKHHQSAQEALRKQEQRFSAAERHAEHCTKGETRQCN